MTEHAVKLNSKEIWARALEILKEKLPESTYQPWITPLSPADVKDECYKEGVFVLKSSLSFGVSHLNQNHLPEIQNAVSEAAGAKTAIEIVYVPEAVKKTKKRDNTQALIQAQLHELRQLNSYSGLNVDYTFENFVNGDNSNVAYKAAKLTAEAPGKKFNPLFITGCVGIGKTHLMQAIGHEIQKKFPEMRVKYTKTEEFTNQLVSSCRGGSDTDLKMRKFRDEYRKNVDVLLLDDIQFAEGKGRTEEEIFNTFDALFHSGKQIVFASDRPIETFKGTPERLKSRYEWGLSVEIKMPDFNTRKEIIKNHAKRSSNGEISDDVAEFLAENFTKNVRELQGAYNKVSAYASIQEIELTVENAKEILGFNKEKKEITIETIIEKTAECFNVTTDDIKGSQRANGIMAARQAAIYLSREILDLSFPILAKSFNKNHTTIIYSYDKLKKDITTNIALKEKIKEIEKLIRG